MQYWENKGIETRFTSVHHPEANPVETRMKIIGDCFRILCPTDHRKWIDHIRAVEHRLNETYHCTTGHPSTTLFFKKKFDVEGELIDITEEEYQQVLKKAKETTKHQLDQRKDKNPKKKLTEFQPGDLVYAKTFHNLLLKKELLEN